MIYKLVYLAIGRLCGSCFHHASSARAFKLAHFAEGFEIMQHVHFYNSHACAIYSSQIRAGRVNIFEVCESLFDALQIPDLVHHSSADCNLALS